MDHMSLNLAEKLKSLRKERNVSQEKLAAYLEVSFQAVSKWENGNTCPDIALLPDIARFFGITIDELLQVEKIDEERLYQEYESRAEEQFRNRNYREMLSIWQEAYHQMPNKIEVKEMLMSSYFDVDKVKYQNEIIELGTEIYNSDVPMYYKGQAIREIANTYAAIGKTETAKKWVRKSVQLMHSQDILYTEISEGEELLKDVNFCIFWIFRKLFYMAARIDNDSTISRDKKQEMYQTVAQLYEVLHEKGKLDEEALKMLQIMHDRIAELAGE